MKNKTRNRNCKVEISLEDNIRKDMIETILRSYADKHALSYLIVELNRLNNKYNFNNKY